MQTEALNSLPHGRGPFWSFLHSFLPDEPVVPSSLSLIYSSSVRQPLCLFPVLYLFHGIVICHWCHAFFCFQTAGNLKTQFKHPQKKVVLAGVTGTGRDRTGLSVAGSHLAMILCHSLGCALVNGWLPQAGPQVGGFLKQQTLCDPSFTSRRKTN